MSYHPGAVSSFYDQYGEREWNRLDSSAHARLIYHLHTHFYRAYIGPGRRVLDAGVAPEHALTVRMAAAESIAAVQSAHNDLRMHVGERVNEAIDEIQRLLEEADQARL